MDREAEGGDTTTLMSLIMTVSCAVSCQGSAIVQSHTAQHSDLSYISCYQFNLLNNHQIERKALIKIRVACHVSMHDACRLCLLF